MHVPWLNDRRPKPFGDSDQDVVQRDMLGHPFTRTEAVLERHDNALGFEQRCDLRRHLVDSPCLRRDNPNVTGSSVLGGASNVEVVNDVAAAGT